MSQINIARFCGNKNWDTVFGLDQWDYGQILRIQGLDLPDAVEIHFSLQETGGEAKRRIGIRDGDVTDVVIPDFILEGDGATEDYKAYAFIYLSSEEFGKTTHKIIMQIKARPKPEGHTKSDETTFGAIMDAVNKLAAGQVSEEQIKAAVEEYMKEHQPEDSAEVYMRVSEGYVQYSNDNESWSNVIAVSELKDNTAVQFVQQELTEEEKTQARVNISAATIFCDTETKTLNIFSGEAELSEESEETSDCVIEKIVVDGKKLSFMTDDTLTISGKAADAKVTGDKISELSEQKVDGIGIKSIIALTQAKYDALEEKVATTLYIVTDATSDSDGSGDSENEETQGAIIPYITSDGVAYINLEHSHIDGASYEVCMRAIDGFSGESGVISTLFGNRYTCIWSAGGKNTSVYMAGYYNGSSYATFGSGTVDVTKKRIFKMSSTSLELDDGTVTEITAGTNAKVSNMYLFALNSSDQNNGEYLANLAKMTFFYLKIRDANGELIYDYRPAQDAEGIACIYEEVNGTYLYNAAESGSFVYGTELEES